MKRLMTVLLISMMFLPLLAEERKIELQSNAHNVERRSLVYIPTVILAGNTLHIYSGIPLENLQVTITNLSTGVAFHFNNITVFYGQPYTLYLAYMKDSNYKIEINIKEACYYGYFEFNSDGIE